MCSLSALCRSRRSEWRILVVTPADRRTHQDKDTTQNQFMTCLLSTVTTGIKPYAETLQRGSEPSASVWRQISKI